MEGVQEEKRTRSHYPGEISSVELWWIVLRDEKEDFHGVEIRVRWFSLGQLDRCDAQRPNVSFAVVEALEINRG